MTWIYKNSSYWCDLPERFGSWSTVYTRYNNRSENEAFQKLFTAFHATRGRDEKGAEGAQTNQDTGLFKIQPEHENPRDRRRLGQPHTTAFNARKYK
jgi:hypothetical protein